MGLTIDLLSAKERKLLVLFYGTETHEALKRLIDLERLELAKDSLDQQDIMQVRYLSGQAMGLKKLREVIFENYKKGDIAEKRTTKV